MIKKMYDSASKLLLGPSATPFIPLPNIFLHKPLAAAEGWVYLWEDGS